MTSPRESLRDRWYSVAYISDGEILVTTRSTSLVAINLIPGSCYAVGETPRRAEYLAGKQAEWFATNCPHYQGLN